MNTPYGIIKEAENSFRVRVNIQDGVEECGTFETEAEARKAWKRAEATLNGRDVKKRDAPLFIKTFPTTVDYVRVG